jgi:triphosphatase
MGTEIELKLAAPEAAVRKAASLPWLQRLAAAKPEAAKLQSVYFDTQKSTLRNQGVSLRVRTTGDHHLQTIKSAGRALLGRKEWEQDIGTGTPQLDLADDTALAPLLTPKLREQLQPLFETDVNRVTLPVHLGKSELELAFDTGEVRTQADQRARIAEIEIELKRGSRRDAAGLMRRLARDIPVTYAPQTKSERGYALLGAGIAAPVFAGAVALAKDETSARAFAAIGFECLRHCAANRAAVLVGDPEGIHQMRVGLRRFRAAISLFKKMLAGSELSKIKAELKWLTEQLGPARDGDVFLAKTVAPFRKRHQEQTEFALLEKDVARKRQAGFAQARAAAHSDRFRRLMLDLAVWLLDGDWRHASDPLRRAMRQERIADFARRELERRTRKIVKRVAKLDRLDGIKRHRLRIAVKKLRYGRRFFADLKPAVGRGRRAERMDVALKRLQTALGDLNDMRVHAAWAHDMARDNVASRKAFAMGYLAGREAVKAHDLIGAAGTAGKQLKRAA